MGNSAEMTFPQYQYQSDHLNGGVFMCLSGIKHRAAGNRKPIRQATMDLNTFEAMMVIAPPLFDLDCFTTSTSYINCGDAATANV